MIGGPLKVLHVIPSIGPQRGGPSVAAVAMCRALAQIGVDARIVCTHDDGPGVLDVPLGGWTSHLGVPTWFVPRAELWPGALREFQIGRGFSSWLAAHADGFDLLHVHALFSHLPSAAMLFARRANVPYVLRPLGILEGYSLRRSAWKKRLFLRLVDAANIRSASAIHLTSRREDEVSVIPGSAPRWIIPLGVDLPEVAPVGSKSGPFRIVFLSRWHEKKRIDVLLAALGLVRDLDWHLDLAGAGRPELDARIRQLVASSGFPDRVSTPGFVAGAEKSRLLNEGNLFVLPSASENFGIAVAEALAHALPCVVTRHVALSDEILESGAGWVCGDSAEDLAGALREAMADRAICLQRGTAARHLAATKFSWASCAESLHAGYSGIVSARPPRRSS